MDGSVEAVQREQLVLNIYEVSLATGFMLLPLYFQQFLISVQHSPTT
jgi:hypothetical protein